MGTYCRSCFWHPDFEKAGNIKPTIMEDGQLAEHANPFAKIIMEDLHELGKIGSAEQFDEAWDGTMKQLLNSEEIADMLGRIDPAVMRAAFLSGQWGDKVEKSLLA